MQPLTQNDLAKQTPWADESLLYFVLIFTSLVASASFFTGFALSMQGGYPSELLNNHLWSAALYVCFFSTMCIPQGPAVEKE
jgi:hypothetical protein